jgi:hypothetical protein
MSTHSIAVTLCPPRRPWICAATGLASLLVLTGCSTVNLKKVVITSMTASLPKGPGIAPGEKSSLVVSMTKANGKVVATSGSKEGKVSWNDLRVTATVVAAGNKGKVSLPADPRVSEGQLPHVTVTVPSHPDLRADLDIPLHYDRKFSANFQGSDGNNGNDGASGMDGMDGASGSLDPDHPGAGGDGGAGSNGSNGSDGGGGGDGPPVTVRVALSPGARTLLQVVVSAKGRDRLFLVDPNGGSLTVTSSGGAGGSGGSGGSGGRGGSGGLGSPSGMRGRDGQSGRAGSNGVSGNPGSIAVIYDPQVRPLLKAIDVAANSRNTFKEQQVGALW